MTRGLGMYAWFGYELPLEDALHRMKDAGFTHALLWWGEMDGGVPLAAQPELVRRLGLEVDNAHAPFDGCNTLWLPGEAGEAYADSLCACLRGCAEAGVPTLVAHLVDGPAPPPLSTLGLSRLQRVAEEAARTGVRLALENLRHPAYTAAALNALPGAEVGFCYDSGHYHLSGGPPALPEAYGTRLAALHLHDNNGSGDAHGLPFDGTIDWHRQAAALVKTAYTGPVALEVQAYGGYEAHMDADTFVRRAYEATQRVRTLWESAAQAKPTACEESAAGEKSETGEKSEAAVRTGSPG